MFKSVYFSLCCLACIVSRQLTGKVDGLLPGKLFCCLVINLGEAWVRKRFQTDESHKNVCVPDFSSLVRIKTTTEPGLLLLRALRKPGVALPVSLSCFPESSPVNVSYPQINMSLTIRTSLKSVFSFFAFITPSYLQ